MIAALYVKEHHVFRPGGLLVVDEIATVAGNNARLDIDGQCWCHGPGKVDVIGQASVVNGNTDNYILPGRTIPQRADSLNLALGCVGFGIDSSYLEVVI